MSSDNYVSTPIHVECSSCHSPVVVTGFHWHLRFPADDDLIERLLKLTLNLSSCPACGGGVRVLAPLLATHLDTRQLLLVEGAEALAPAFQDASGRNLAERLPAARLTVCDDYHALRDAMLPWVFEHLNEMAVATLTGNITRADAKERLQLATRLRLRLLRLVADDVLTIQLEMPEEIQNSICEQTKVPDIAAALRQLWPLQTDALVFQLLQDEAAEAQRSSGPEGLKARIEQRMTPGMFSPRLLQWCQDECIELSAFADDWSGFAPAYWVHYLNAVAHQLAGEANPRCRAWAGFLHLAHDASLDGGFEDAWLPSPEDARLLVRFEDLWSRCAPGMFGKATEKRSEPVRATTDFMQRMGHGERLLDMMRAGPVRFELPPSDSAEERSRQGERVVESAMAVLREHFVFPLEAERREAFASVAAGQVNLLIKNGLPDPAGELAQRLAAWALDARDYVAAFDVGVRSVEHLARGELFAHAASVLHPLMEVFSQPAVEEQLGRDGVQLTVHFWNEAGNVMRQLRRFETALQAYALSRTFSALVEAPHRDHLEQILWANEARVFRDMGRYAEAKQRLTELLKRNPGDVPALHSLAMLHLALNEPNEARACVDRALGIVDKVADALLYGRLLQTRGLAWSAKGDPLAALRDLALALERSPPGAGALETQICIATAMAAVSGSLPVPARVRLHLEAVVRGEVDHAASGLQTNLRATAALALCELLLAHHPDAELRAFCDDWLDPLLAPLQDGKPPWQLCALRGRVALRLDGKRQAWPWFERALAMLDADVPKDEEATAALGWLRDKNSFHLELADLAIELARDGHIETRQLIPIFESVNARSTSAKMGARSVLASAETVSRNLREAARALPGTLRVVAFLEGRRHVQCLMLQADDEPRLLEQGAFSAPEMRQMKLRFADALSYVNPTDLDGLDHELRDWHGFARRLGPMLVHGAKPGDTLALLPGASLAALPLHLSPVDAAGTTLIERHPVIYCGNFTTLVNPAPSVGFTDHGRTLVVEVARAKDDASFRTALHNAATALVAASAGPTQVLSATQATRVAILAALERCDEAYFLCHGADGGRQAGFALCVSDGVSLPPSALAIDAVPELKRFTLDWLDLEALQAAPWLLVSMACSTGRTVVDSGGSRLGMEQALLARGTSAIVSPQWDIDQVAALSWLGAFGARAAEDDPSIAARVSRATIATREQFGHWYFWGPFTLTGSLFKFVTQPK